MQKIKNIIAWYEKYERPISTGSLGVGFIFDYLTMQRVDALRENTWIGVNLIFASLVIILLNRKQDPQSHFWLLNILQFSFGALLGAFFIFYFRSATLESAWPFLLVLLAAMVANELFQKRYARLTFQVSFLYLSLFAFSIFLLPLVLHRIGTTMFLLSGAFSFAVVVLFLWILAKFVPGRLKESKTLIWRSVIGIFAVINVLYFTNLIPPIPLVLKDSGIYHSLERLPNGTYLARAEEKEILDRLRLSEEVELVPGQPLYAYSAIFSPAHFGTKVIHEWQYKDAGGEWVTESRIPLFLVGGRAEGFRTYSSKNSLSPGQWRVNVVTENGQVIGRLRFKIKQSTRTPSLINILKG